MTYPQLRGLTSASSPVTRSATTPRGHRRSSSSAVSPHLLLAIADRAITPVDACRSSLDGSGNFNQGARTLSPCCALRHPPAGRAGHVIRGSTQRCSGAGAEVRQDLVDHRPLGDDRHDPHGRVTGGAAERVDLKDLPQERGPRAAGLGGREPGRGDDGEGRLCRRAERVRIAMTFYQEGTPTLTFSTGGFDYNRFIGAP